MKTFIVPTDFSETSKNAALYAAGALSRVVDAQVILYNVYYSSENDDDENNPHSKKSIMMAALQNLKAEISDIAPALNITTIAERENNESFLDALDRLARHQSADMVIMGITGATKLEQIFIGSNTLDFVEKGTVPVMIVPPDAKYTTIKNVLFTSDFKNVEKSTPSKPLQFILSLFNPVVHVVNVDSEHYVELTEEYKAERAKLDEMLQGFEHEFYFMRLFDFKEAIDVFAQDYKIDLIINVPRKHSFLAGLYKTNYTKKLAYHTHVPLIAIHE